MSDPFSAENAPAVSLIVLMRLYDVGMALLRELNEDVHDQLDAHHRGGGIGWSLPSIDLTKQEENNDDDT